MLCLSTSMAQSAMLLFGDVENKKIGLTPCTHQSSIIKGDKSSRLNVSGTGHLQNTLTSHWENRPLLLHLGGYQWELEVGWFAGRLLGLISG